LTGLTGFSGYMFSQFPEETKKIPSACGGKRNFNRSHAYELLILSQNADQASDSSPKAIEFGHSHLENGQKNPNDPVNPV